MQSSDSVKFAEAIGALGECLERLISPVLVRCYWVALKDFDIDVVQKACDRAGAELTFFPKPVELRRLCGEMAPEERALMAWQSVIDTVRAVGTYTSVDFDDPLVNATIRNMGGWIWLGKQTDEEIKWTRKDFDRVYCSMINAPLSDEALGYLPGLSEHTRAAHYEIEAPRVIVTGLPPHSSGVLKGRTVKRIEAATGGDGRKIAELVGEVLWGAK